MGQESSVTIGRIVHFSMDRGPSRGQPRPGIVVYVKDGAVVNLQVFTNGGGDSLPDVVWRTDIDFDVDDTGKPGTWRWPPRV